MGIRMFCDNCGSTVTKSLNVYSYGAEPPRTDMPSRAIQSIGQLVGGPQGGVFGGGSGGGGVFGTPQQQAMTPTAYHRETVELCDTCGPIWLKRVSNLTKQSDPDAKA